MFIDNYENAKETLIKLSSQGIKFSLDDFGTGYSSLSYLANLPFDILKIDRSFIADVENKPNQLKLLSSVIALGHKLDLSIVAEGVETVAQRDIVSMQGCDIIQGYLYSRPLPYDQIRQYIDHFNQRKGQL